jgi:hypothetical protein
MPAVAISWVSSTDTTVTYYNIYCGTVNGGPYTYDGSPTYDTSPKNVGNVSFASFTVPDTGTYYFVVTAYSPTNGESAPSPQTQYPLNVGTPPTGTPVLSVR